MESDSQSDVSQPGIASGETTWDLVVTGSIIEVHQPKLGEWWAARVDHVFKKTLGTNQLRKARVTWIDGLRVGSSAEIDQTHQIRYA